jgi:hypothetical protein
MLKKEKMNQMKHAASRKELSMQQNTGLTGTNDLTVCNTQTLIAG